jgi:hypothetical protein
VKTRVLSIVTLFLGACGGPTVHFDPKPAPGWINARGSGVGGGSISAVGAAPATLEPQRDADLATRDGKSRIAQLFDSEVKSRSTDWTLASTRGEKTVTAQSVEVRSNVRVDEVTVDSSYRDEATRTHYVQVSVDRGAWSKRVQKRLEDGLTEVNGHVDAAGKALAAGRVTTALKETLAGYQKGQALEPDFVVADLIATDLRARERLATAKKGLDEAARKIRAEHPVALDVTGPADAKARFVADVTKFLGSYGFTVAEKPAAGALRLKATLGERFARAETVAGRSEKLHAAQGKVQLLDADGAPVAGLDVDLGPDRYTERDVDDGKAKEKALMLAADTASSLFRSAFRRAYPTAE